MTAPNCGVRQRKTQRDPAGWLSPPETVDKQQRLLHKLQVHQIELEMQNSELRQARGDLEALSLLKEIDPQVQSIISSGYFSDPVMANYREYGFSAVLSKPFRLTELTKVLKDLLLS